MPYIDTHDETRLFYVDTGAGLPVVLVASAWLNSGMWEFQIPRLVESGCRCIACDRRGHGRSDCPWTGYDYDTLADDLATLIDRLELRNVVLVGHSAGAGEVVRYLTRHGSDRVAAVAIVSGTTPFPMKTTDNPEGLPSDLMQADMARRTKDRARWFAENADGFFGIGLPGVEVSSEYVQFTVRECLSCSVRATAAFFLSGFVTDFRRELRAIDVPTLIVHGDHDVQAPLALCGARTAELVRHNTFRIYQDAAHGLFATHADQLNDDLCAFIRSVATGPLRQLPDLANSRGGQ